MEISYNLHQCINFAFEPIMSAANRYTDAEIERDKPEQPKEDLQARTDVQSMAPNPSITNTDRFYPRKISSLRSRASGLLIQSVHST